MPNRILLASLFLLITSAGCSGGNGASAPTCVTPPGAEPAIDLAYPVSGQTLPSGTNTFLFYVRPPGYAPGASTVTFSSAGTSITASPLSTAVPSPLPSPLASPPGAVGQYSLLSSTVALPAKSTFSASIYLSDDLYLPARCQKHEDYSFTGIQTGP